MRFVLWETRADFNVGDKVLIIQKMMKRHPRQPHPRFTQSSAQHSGTAEVSDAILRQARKTGQLNLSNRSLEIVPESVWKINIDTSAGGVVEFDTSGSEQWWDQTDLVKLILADNFLKELSEDIKLLPSLTVLDVHGNHLVGLPHALGELQKLTRLVLSHNELSSIVPELCMLSHLQFLKLDHNKLMELPCDMCLLTSLEELDVSHNNLSALPPKLGEVHSLLRLRATHNQLKTLPETFGSIKGLRELSLNNNKLTTLPVFSAADKLQTMELHYNCLVEVPVIRPGIDLKELRLGANRLTELNASAIMPLTSLVLLDLRDNSIRSLPEVITELKKLERLDLTNNDLSGLPYVMGLMPNLKSIMLDGNPLRTLRRDIVQRGTTEILKYLRSRIQKEGSQSEKPHHQAVSHCLPTDPQPIREGNPTQQVTLSSEMRLLDITRKSLTAIPTEIFQHHQLTDLLAGYNKLNVVPPEIGQLTVLSVLDLRNNHLSGLPQELGNCSGLRDIVLSFNRLKELPPVLYTLEKLENIIADDNQIETINVDGLLQLPMIGCLDLQNNNISRVPPNLGNVTSLKHLQLGGNPFRNPRPAVLAKGTVALLEYLRDRIPT